MDKKKIRKDVSEYAKLLAKSELSTRQAAVGEVKEFGETRRVKTCIQKANCIRNVHIFLAVNVWKLMLYYTWCVFVHAPSLCAAT